MDFGEADVDMKEEEDNPMTQQPQHSQGIDLYEEYNRQPHRWAYSTEKSFPPPADGMISQRVYAGCPMITYSTSLASKEFTLPDWDELPPLKPGEKVHVYSGQMNIATSSQPIPPKNQ